MLGVARIPIQATPCMSHLHMRASISVLLCGFVRDPSLTKPAQLAHAYDVASSLSRRGGYRRALERHARPRARAVSTRPTQCGGRLGTVVGRKTRGA